MRRSEKSLKEQGIVTIAFLLVSIIVMSFMLYFFKLCVTLTHISIVQYISYSTARKLYLGRQGKETEAKEIANNHYIELRQKFFKNKYLSDDLDQDWFYIYPSLTEEGGQMGFFSMGTAIPETSPYRKMFYGIGSPFGTDVFEINIPFLTDVEKQDDQPPIIISSFLGREPSAKECEEFFEKREEAIKNYFREQGLNIEGGVFPKKDDNGC